MRRRASSPRATALGAARHERPRNQRAPPVPFRSRRPDACPDIGSTLTSRGAATLPPTACLACVHGGWLFPMEGAGAAPSGLPQRPVPSPEART